MAFVPSQDLCYDNESVGLASRSTIVAVDKLDFVFVDGDSRLLPWNVRTRKVRGVADKSGGVG